MRLLTVGDSFTYGEELADLSSAWSNLLANKLGYELTNLAIPGGGNTQMIRHVVEQANNYDLVIIAWSHWARIEFADKHGVYDAWPGNQGLSFKDECEFRSRLLEYITKHHDDDYFYKQQLINVILTQQYLKSLGKKYLMVTAFADNSKVDAFAELNDQIDRDFYIGWPNETMMEWTYGCPKGPKGHFLEQGHEIVSDKIYEHIRHLGWVS
jgi:hypothetical protein